jgi:hypothetical protein
MMKEIVFGLAVAIIVLVVLLALCCLSSVGAWRLAMVIEILLVVDLFLWFLALLPVQQITQFSWASSWLAWIAAVLLALFLFVPGIR